MYTRDSVEHVKEAIDMADLVGAKTELRGVGGRLMGLCPFHDERSPSFSVDADKKVYNCFGCDAGGDGITFVMETEAVDFSGALELLADRYGVELKRENEDPEAERRRRRRERLMALLERASKFYAAYLWQADEAAASREYLLGRGLREDTLRAFGVGFAPGGWDRLTKKAKDDGFSDDELLATGLAQRRREGTGVLDRFRGRITFPLTNSRGRVSGFGARATTDEQRPKYLNTAEGEVFHKGEQLFRLDLARRPAARSGRLVVVEGYTDVLALHQAGIPEAVAIMGTALTGDQLKAFGRTAPSVIVALDADSSGQAAMSRAAQEAERTDVELAVVELPAGRDPADLLEQEGPEALAARFESTIPALEFEVRRVLSEADLGTPAGVDRALDRLRPLVIAAPENSELRDHLTRSIQDRVNLSKDKVRARLSAPPASLRPATEPTPVPVPSELAPVNERAFLTHCLATGAAGRSYLGRVQDAHLTSEVARRARDHLVEHFEDPLDGLSDDDPALKALVTRLYMAARAVGEYSEPSLERDLLHLEQRRLEREIRLADPVRAGELARAKQELRRQFDSVQAS